MPDSEVKHIVIVGSAAEAAITVAAMAISLRGSDVRITLIHSLSNETAPPLVVSRGGLQSFHRVLGIDEQALMNKASGAFGLGTRYRGFLSNDRDVFVPLGRHGMTLRLVDFHHYVAKLRTEGSEEDYNSYSLPALAAATGRFTPPGGDADPVQKTVDYDTYFDRGRYAQFMRDLALSLGAEVLISEVETACLDSNGAIEYVLLADGIRVDGDFFIDCSNNRALIGRLNTESEVHDWSQWLPCDRIASVKIETHVSPDLFSSIEANDNGWVQRTMSGVATINSFVYSSQYTDDEFAKQFLEKNVHRAMASDVHVAIQRAGYCSKPWIKNCVAIGPAAVTLEPMEVSPMHLAQSAVLRLLAMLPRRKNSESLATEYNRKTSGEVTSVRDYQTLRYALSDRRKGLFWERFEKMTIPDSLQSRIDLFKNNGRTRRRDNDYPSKANWISSFINFGYWPSSYDPLADMIDEQSMRKDISQFREQVQHLGSLP